MTYRLLRIVALFMRRGNRVLVIGLFTWKQGFPAAQTPEDCPNLGYPLYGARLFPVPGKVIRYVNRGFSPLTSGGNSVRIPCCMTDTMYRLELNSLAGDLYIWMIVSEGIRRDS